MNTLQPVAERIRAHGWRQGPALKPKENPARCLIQTVAEVFDGREPSARLAMFGEIARRLNLPHPENPNAGIAAAVVKWNDTPGRTVEEVLAVLDMDDVT